MASQPSYRESFIRSSIETARLYGFGGLDLSWTWPNTDFDMKNIGVLLDEWRDEWRAAINSESGNTSEPRLVLTMAVHRMPIIGATSFPVESILRNIDWANIIAFDYQVPLKENVTGNHAALYDPSGHVSTDSSIKEWLRRGFPASKLVLGVAYHGYAWTLMNPNDNSIGVPASGPALSKDGSIGYKFIKTLIPSYGYGATSVYNATYVVNYFTIGTLWINFDDVEAIGTKVSYAKTKGLLGYNAFQLSNDHNWQLSRAAFEVGNKDNGKKKQLHIIIISLPSGMVIFLLLLGSVSYYVRSRIKSKGKIELGKLLSFLLGPKAVGNEYPDQNAPNLQVFKFSEIKAATSNFSHENRLGEGGYGPVYKGTLETGQEIAVKRLSKTSHQGLKEFKNEVKLTAKLQNVNLVRLLGFCTEKGEKMLIYEYMPNKSLDFYLFDPNRRLKLNWEQRVHIIEGIAQGLLYLQEYSNFTKIHRDIKASNILLDNWMKPKFQILAWRELLGRRAMKLILDRQIVGTYGYVPPDYVRRGVYSIKYDVYSFGVLLLQIISGKKNTYFYGSSENLNLLEYAYDLWKMENRMEFMDSTLDDSFSPCKLLRCLQVALLCVQESPTDRPSILEVYSMLKNENIAIACPKKPAFSVKSGEAEENGICSINNVSISQMLPR
ncbi:hypothetical protein P3X46_031754 [Hevea brasiliensis]|uniref:Protein kinase domain-containing protein n=1 Tax=Hevea brasiliensis TaxID=3981 RepID=A0ABQ9KLC9_HEVBR|nr:hypothetical protein P3X46_031754 [Hevea brasiliensis]